jgi:hypothetical protein
MQVIEVLEEHYELQEVPFGRSYTWCPECIVVECDCSERLTFKMSAIIGLWAVCECGADLTNEIQEKLQGHRPEARGQLPEDYEATHHPWLHDTEAQSEQHLRNEAAYAEGSPWRYNDITSLSPEDERNVH